jgi:hypothetical protein
MDLMRRWKLIRRRIDERFERKKIQLRLVHAKILQVSMIIFVIFPSIVGSINANDLII